MFRKLWYIFGNNKNNENRKSNSKESCSKESDENDNNKRSLQKDQPARGTFWRIFDNYFKSKTEKNNEAGGRKNKLEHHRGTTQEDWIMADLDVDRYEFVKLSNTINEPLSPPKQQQKKYWGRKTKPRISEPRKDDCHHRITTYQNRHVDAQEYLPKQSVEGETRYENIGSINERLPQQNELLIFNRTTETTEDSTDSGLKAYENLPAFRKHISVETAETPESPAQEYVKNSAHKGQEPINNYPIEPVGRPLPVPLAAEKASAELSLPVRIAPNPSDTNIAENKKHPVEISWDQIKPAGRRGPVHAADQARLQQKVAVARIVNRNLDGKVVAPAPAINAADPAVKTIYAMDMRMTSSGKAIPRYTPLTQNPRPAAAAPLAKPVTPMMTTGVPAVKPAAPVLNPAAAVVRPGATALPPNKVTPQQRPPNAVVQVPPSAERMKPQLYNVVAYQHSDGTIVPRYIPVAKAQNG